MKFKYEDLEHSVLCESSDDELGLEFIEASSWEQDHKWQSRYIIFKYNGKYYRIYETRSGSPFTDWHYEDGDIDTNGNIECEEVFKKEIISEFWSSSQSKSEIEELKSNISYAKVLLQEARSLMDRTHCYDTDIYREIGIFLYGEDD